MARYGGVIERAIRTSGAPDEPFEVHVLRFPGQELYDAFRDDAERRSLSGERAGIITNSDSLVKYARTGLWLLILLPPPSSTLTERVSRASDLSDLRS